MSALAEFFATRGEEIAVRNSQPLSVGDSHCVYLVKDGAVELFTTTVGENGVPGTRSNFLTVEAGRLFFGMVTGSDTTRVIGSGVLGTSVIALSLSEFRSFASEPENRAEAAASIDAWVGDISAVLVEIVGEPQLGAILAPGTPHHVSAGARVGATTQPVWVTAEFASAFYDGVLPITLGPIEPLIPLAEGSYLDMSGPAELHASSTESCLSDERFWNGLLLVNSWITAIRMLGTDFSGLDEVYRQQVRRDYREGARRDALESLVRVIDVDATTGGEAAGSRADDLLFETCRAIGAVAGIHIRRHQEVQASRNLRTNLGLIAKASRFRLRRVLLEGRWWEQEFGPTLAFRKSDNSPVAILPAAGGDNVLFDARTNRTEPITREIAATLAPFGEGVYRSFSDLVTNAREFLKFALHGLRSEFLVVLLMSISVGLLGTLTPFFTGKIFDSVIPTADRQMLWHYVAALISAAIATGAFNFVRNIAVLRVEGKMDYVGQSAIWSRMLDLPMTFFRAHSSGDLADRAFAVDHIRSKFSDVGVTTMLSVTTILFQGLAMSMINFKLAAVGLAIIAVMVAIITAANWFQLRFQRQEYAIRGRIASIALELMSGVTKIRVAAAEDHAFRLWARSFSSQKRVAFIIGRIQNFVQVVKGSYPVLASMIIFAALFMFNKKAAQGASISTGQFIAFNTAFTAVMGALLELSLGMLQLLEIIPIFERVRPVICEPPEVTDERRHPGELKGNLELYHLNFRYDKDGPLILKNVDLKIRKGQFVAIVGASGSGKSTILRLLLGFEQPESGYVYYDGQDLNSLDLRELRKQIGTVLQTSQLMPTTIFQNIIAASTSLTLEDAALAALRAGMDKDIENMPMGMHTVVSEGGGGFSGGQKQRLMIARALVNRPRVVFFDEATSALDNRTQNIVTKSLREMDATRITIAHRLSTVVDADRIIVMDQGEIVESGTYAELMTNEGKFFELAQRQQAEESKEEKDGSKE